MYIKSSLIILLYTVCYVFSDVLVTLPNGQIRGNVLQTPANRNFYAFQGIPYANPPVGELRFQAPVAKNNWTGIVNATKTSNRCYSVVKDTDDESEDCLYLNVYTPILETENTTKLPVMVFIYGGGFRDGASAYSTYGPDFLLESEDIVVVSFNYRVGPFGFLSTGDEVVPGNAGLKDQVLALKWTNQNIGLFGGDSSRITIFGQSAGGASVCYHILSKQSTGLFRAGIAESGSALNEWGFLADPRPYGFELASIIGNSTIADSTELLEFLQSVAAKEIDEASTKTVINDRALPVLEIESDDAFITKEMYELLAAGDINKVPLLIGINSQESLGNAADPVKFYNTLVKYENDATLLIPNDLNLDDSANRSELAEEIKRIYVEEGKKMQDNPGISLGYFSDNSYTRPNIKHAELQSNHTDVYFYQFSHKGPMGNNNISVEGLGEENVGHSEERNYYFRTQSASYDNSDLSQFPVSDVLTHHRMVKIWTNFAKTMNPTPEKIELLQNIIWPKVKPDDFQYVDINNDLEIRTNPKEKRYQGWKDVYEKWGNRPFATF